MYTFAEEKYKNFIYSFNKSIKYLLNFADKIW